MKDTDAIKFAVLPFSSGVEAFSNAPIPCEHHHDTLNTLRSQLKEAVSVLTADDRAGLMATYGSASEGHVADVENRLFFNISEGMCRPSAHHQLCFKLLSCAETTDLLHQRDCADYSHYYHYEITDCRDLFEAREPLIAWRDIPFFRLRGDHKPYEYWRTMQAHRSHFHISSSASLPHTGCFGLAIHINSPEDALMNLATPLKSMLDGIICAFHQMPPTAPDELAVLAQRLGCSADIIANNPLAVLGEQRYYRLAGNRLIADPQDHRCTRASVTISYGMPAWSIRGALVPLP